MVDTALRLTIIVLIVWVRSMVMVAIFRCVVFSTVSHFQSYAHRLECFFGGGGSSCVENMTTGDTSMMTMMLSLDAFNQILALDLCDVILLREI